MEGGRGVDLQAESSIQIYLSLLEDSRATLFRPTLRWRALRFFLNHLIVLRGQVRHIYFPRTIAPPLPWLEAIRLAQKTSYVSFGNVSGLNVPIEAQKGLLITHSDEEFIGLSEFLRGFGCYLQVWFGISEF